jgi:hypothetical protein
MIQRLHPVNIDFVSSVGEPDPLCPVEAGDGALRTRDLAEGWPVVAFLRFLFIRHTEIFRCLGSQGAH